MSRIINYLFRGLFDFAENWTQMSLGSRIAGSQ